MNYLKSILLAILCLSAFSAYAQTKDSIMIDSATNQPYKILTDSTKIVPAGQSNPDEDLNDIFSPQLNHLTDNQYIKEIFDIQPNQYETEYPRNLQDSVYINRLMQAEEIIDLTYNNVVKNFIQLYTEKGRKEAEAIVGLSTYYFPIFEEILDKHNMPLELKYLPIIESALNPVARSRAGATGLWQFMFHTGRNLDLEITNYIDERRDPVKSTEAAVKYLQSLYNIYKNWHLTIAAYNCGPGNVNKAIRRSGGKRNYWDIYYWLPRETRGYVPGFIAVVYAMKYHKEHNLQPVYPKIPLNVDTLHIKNYLHFKQIASQLDINIQKIRLLNPLYRKDIIPAQENRPYPLVLPIDKVYEFIDKEKDILAYNRAQFFPNNTLKTPNRKGEYATPTDISNKAKIRYTVKYGDNVGYIASWFNVRSSDVRAWNNIRRNLIREGQKLVIYVPKKSKNKYKKVDNMSFAQKQEMIGANSNPSTKRATQPIDKNYVYHTVKQGDNIWDIAKKYTGVSSRDILRLNNITDVRGLFIGQKLKIKKK